MRYLTVSFMLFMFLIGCGGSGGSNNFEGSWAGTLTLRSDEPQGCSSEATIDPIYVVHVSGDIISVTELEGLELSGAVTSPTSFEANFAVGSGLSPTSFKLTFTDAENDSAQATFVDSQGSYSPDAGFNGCTKTFSGMVSR